MKTMPRFCCLLVPLLTLLPALADGSAVQVFDVDAGTRLVLAEDHRVPLVHLQIDFPAGTDSPWVREHHADIAFEAQVYDPAGRLRRRADDLGVSLSLWTSAEASTLRASFLADDLQSALDLVRQVLGNDDFDRRELRRWRKTRAVNWKLQLKSPHFRLRQAQMRLLFRPDDPRRLAVERPPKISTRIDEVRAARDTLLRLPGRIIGLSGAITAEQAQAAAAGLLPPPLEKTPAGIEPNLQPAIPRAEQPDPVVVRLPRLTQVYFALTRESLTDDDPRYPALMLADHALGGYFFSRLYRALRHEGGETYGARTSGRGGAVSTAYALTTFTRTDNAAHTEQKLRRVLEELHRGGIDDEERNLAASALRGRRLRVVQDPARRLAEAMADLRHGRPPGFRDRLVQAAARVSVDEVNQVIEEFYDPANFVMVRVEPR